MSSTTNHAKRAHRSESRKRSALRSTSARSWYRQDMSRTRRSIFSRLFNRKTPEQQNRKHTNTNDNI